jgi:hypothetical protein
LQQGLEVDNEKKNVAIFGALILDWNVELKLLNRRISSLEITLSSKAKVGKISLMRMPVFDKFGKVSICL